MGFRGRPLLPAASAFSGALAGHALEEWEFEGNTQRAPLGRPRTELVCKHVSMCPDWPVLLLGAMWVRSLGSHILVREGFCSRLGLLGDPHGPHLIPLALVHTTLCLTASCLFLFIS